MMSLPSLNETYYPTIYTIRIRKIFGSLFRDGARSQGREQE